MCTISARRRVVAEAVAEAIGVEKAASPSQKA
jgi:hypothetical protein